jgi:putative Mn2+ efflux pump MntP
VLLVVCLYPAKDATMNFERIAYLALGLGLLAFVVWAILHFVPMPSPFPQAIIFVVIILVAFGVFRELRGSA